MENTDNLIDNKAHTRIEKDLLGEQAVPATALYGIQTQRAAQNFDITGMPISHFPDLIKALAMVKAAAAKANYQHGLLSEEKLSAITDACSDLIQGEHHEQFIVDLIQGGAGTSTNMNANEVIANIGLKKMGFEYGQYSHLHPNNDVNRSQSTNDVYPSAARLAMVFAAKPLQEAIIKLQNSLAIKGKEFSSILKMGRTQLQDAVPMTLGQEFNAFASDLGSETARIEDACLQLCELNLGGTAIGTGINAPKGYARLAISELADISGLPVTLSEDLIAASADMGAFITFSSALKRLAIKLSKLSNDLRLLSSGPRTGLGEINLPAMQPGSSIIPGKVNPVIPEAMNQAAFQVMGTDMTITMAAEAGQLQLNAMEPLIVYNLLNNARLLEKSIRMLDERCIQGITANKARCAQHVENSIGIVTALVPHIGYENASRIAGNALLSGSGVAELVKQEKLLSDEELAAILSPDTMVSSI
ncbi:aspartate ammonia-lyase [Psychrobacter pacificensis]|uniref:Aspartate ammonia-lyase n=1 Tax=Psychrobacter pacificensis TaxID=112002 RepID=A0A1G6VDK2_9GAMM|nr:aspartate ammonia-lyase [Psychrobacter pacificensis]SDD51668.1 aspartate ammonia-lyase [Psychrobacter pacificensis]